MALRSLKTDVSASLRRLALQLAISGCCSATCLAEDPAAPPPNTADNRPSAQSHAPNGPGKTWIVRDPATGRLFQQQLVPVHVPVTRWEAKTVEQTVYEPKIATHLQHTPQTTYTPSTRYVMQSKLRGWWNPLQTPVQAYEYVPVTQWVPQTQQLPHPVTTQQWVAKQQKIVIYQPVQATETHQKLVQTELPQPSGAALNPTLAQAPQTLSGPSHFPRRGLVWPSRAATFSPPTPIPTAVYAASQPSLSPSGLRPVLNPPRTQLPQLPLPSFATLPYNAPLKTTTGVTATASRDTLQSGMQPTVLR
jgi:hypothetical protein